MWISRTLPSGTSRSRHARHIDGGETQVGQAPLIAAPVGITQDRRQNIDAKMIEIGPPDGTGDQVAMFCRSPGPGRWALPAK